MTISPAFALQQSIYSTLANAAPVAAFVSGRVYDRVPESPVFPFIHIGDHQLIGDVFQYSGSTDAHVNIHVFSRYAGLAEVLQIEAVVRDALEADIVVNGFTTDYFVYTQSRFLTDPDGLTSHAVLAFHYCLTVE